MNLIEKIKQDQVAARKARNSGKALALTTLIGEAEAIGKTAGNRTPTDDEVVAILKKFIKNIDEVIRVADEHREWDRSDAASTEKSILSVYLPKQLTVEELKSVIEGIVFSLGDNSPKAMGKVLGSLKQSHNGLYDGATASNIVKEILAK